MPKIFHYQSKDLPSRSFEDVVLTNLFSNGTLTFHQGVVHDLSSYGVQFVNLSSAFDITLCIAV